VSHHLTTKTTELATPSSDWSAGVADCYRPDAGSPQAGTGSPAGSAIGARLDEATEVRSVTGPGGARSLVDGGTSSSGGARSSAGGARSSSGGARSSRAGEPASAGFLEPLHRVRIGAGEVEGACSAILVVEQCVPAAEVGQRVDPLALNGGDQFEVAGVAWFCHGAPFRPGPFRFPGGK
jgi:hypothetical protein